MYDRVLHAIACGLHAAGVSTLRFNLRGVGGSEGRFDGGAGEVDDVRAAIDHVARAHDEVTMIGFSFGAWVGLRAAVDEPRVTRLVGVSAPIGVLDFSVLDAIEKPLLLVHGGGDAWASLADVAARVAALRPDAQLATIDGADHFFRGRHLEVTAAVVPFVAAQRVQ